MERLVLADSRAATICNTDVALLRCRPQRLIELARANRKSGRRLLREWQMNVMRVAAQLPGVTAAFLAFARAMLLAVV
jgi:hypothetical protein